MSATSIIPLTKNVTQRSYLVTYSQADIAKIPDKQAFSRAVLKAFETAGGVGQPQYWATGEETHEEGGLHYHMILQLDSPRRWKSVKEALFQAEDIVVHFAEGYCSYSAGLNYVCKEDPHPLKSENHPEHLGQLGETRPHLKRKQTVTDITLTDSDGNVSTERRVVDVQEVKAAKKRRLSAGDIRKFIIEKEIRSSTELMAIAQERADNGEDDLADFCMNLRNEGSISDLVSMAWKLFDAKKKLKRASQSRLDIIEEAAAEPCVPGCEGRWYIMAEQVLCQNGFTAEGFGVSLYDLLANGRGKYRNIIVIGPTNCGKTF